MEVHSQWRLYARLYTNKVLWLLEKHAPSFKVLDFPFSSENSTDAADREQLQMVMCTQEDIMNSYMLWYRIIMDTSGKGLVLQLDCNLCFLFVYTAVCNPLCENGGECTAPGVCSCTSEWTGEYCQIGKQVIMGGIWPVIGGYMG